MATMVLSKLQASQYKEIKKRFEEDGKNMLILSTEDYVRLHDTLLILETLGYIQDMGVDNAYLFRKTGNFDDFEEWQKDRKREERRLSRREWRIAIVSALIGALGGLLPTILTWLLSLNSNG